MHDLRSRFGFLDMPFTPEIPVEKRFALPLFDDTVSALRSTVDQRMSCALIAPAGTGKTAVLRALSAQLPEARYHVHYVKVTDLAKRDMCREIATVVGAPAAGNYPTLVRRIQERFVTSADVEAVRPVLLCDEAHDLRPDVLGMLRLLTNFEMDSRLVVSIVLCGQGNLRLMLRRDALEDIARRLVHIAALRLLSRAETQRYIEHRCAIAQATTSPFDHMAIDAIYEIGRGNLRATDRLALKGLQVAHTRNVDIVDASHIAEARTMLWA